MATVGGIRCYEGSANSLEIDSLARFAVDEHNKKEELEKEGLFWQSEYYFCSHLIQDLIKWNALLVFGKVVNVKQQVVSGTVYYITLEATDGGQKKVYEAKVWVKPWLNFKELQEFKLISDAPSHHSA